MKLCYKAKWRDFVDVIKSLISWLWLNEKRYYFGWAWSYQWAHEKREEWKRKKCLPSGRTGKVFWRRFGLSLRSERSPSKGAHGAENKGQKEWRYRGIWNKKQARIIGIERVVFWHPKFEGSWSACLLVAWRLGRRSGTEIGISETAMQKP